jgi:hypothetical protein
MHKATRRKGADPQAAMGRGTRHLLPESLRSMQELMELLPLLVVDAKGEIDISATPSDVLQQIASHAESSAAAINLGLSAVGSLMAYAAPECTDRTISADAVEAIGWLFAELGATTAICIKLAAACRERPSSL